MISPDHLERSLVGFTDVISLSLAYDYHRGYNLTFVLRNEHEQRIELFCQDISMLQLDQFGGGLTQIHQLCVVDVRSQQLDRIKLRFWDRATDRTSFACANAEVRLLSESEEPDIQQPRLTP
jgi:hypothetical protein